MKLTAFIIIPLLTLSACGGGDDQSKYFGSNEAKDPPPLANNPPLSANDIDSIVNAEEKKSIPKR